MLVLEKSKKAKSVTSQVALGDDFVHTKILDGEGRVVGATFQDKADASTNTEMDLIEPILEAIRQRKVVSLPSIAVQTEEIKIINDHSEDKLSMYDMLNPKEKNSVQQHINRQ